MVTEYITSNWALILVLLGFTISLISTVFLEKKVILRMYALIVEVLLLSVLVFTEFYILDIPEYRTARIILIAFRYSATPFLVAQIIITIIKKQRWYVFIPAIVLTAIDFISIPTGIVFRIDDTNKMQRGPLGLLPYIVVVCRKLPEEEVIELTKRIHKLVAETPYSCSVGYGYSKDGKKPIDVLLSESDENMYAEKQEYYKKTGKTGRDK